MFILNGKTIILFTRRLHSGNARFDNYVCTDGLLRITRIIAYNIYALAALYALKSAPFLYEAKTVVVSQVNVQRYFYRENGASSTIVLSCKRSDAFFIISAFVRIREIMGEK